MPVSTRSSQRLTRSNGTSTRSNSSGGNSSTAAERKTPRTVLSELSPGETLKHYTLTEFKALVARTAEDTLRCVGEDSISGAAELPIA